MTLEYQSLSAAVPVLFMLAVTINCSYNINQVIVKLSLLNKQEYSKNPPTLQTAIVEDEGSAQKVNYEWSYSEQHCVLNELF